jgi:hypothetical protein
MWLPSPNYDQKYKYEAQVKEKENKWGIKNDTISFLIRYVLVFIVF